MILFDVSLGILQVNMICGAIKCFLTQPPNNTCPSLYLPDGILFLFNLYLLASWTLFWGHCLLQQGQDVSYPDVSDCFLAGCPVFVIIACTFFLKVAEVIYVAYFLIQIWKNLLRTMPNYKECCLYSCAFFFKSLYNFHFVLFIL